MRNTFARSGNRWYAAVSAAILNTRQIPRLPGAHGLDSRRNRDRAWCLVLLWRTAGCTLVCDLASSVLRQRAKLNPSIRMTSQWPGTAGTLLELAPFRHEPTGDLYF